MKKQNWKRIFVVLLTLAVLAGFVLFDKDVQNIQTVLQAISPWWLVGALACTLIYFLGDTCMYQIACRDMQIPQPFHEGLITTMIGFFYSALTPLSSGGQPFQVLQMRSRGIHVGTATSVLMVKFMAWHIALSSIGLIGAVFCGGTLLRHSTMMFVLFCIGFCLHAFCAGTGLMLMVRPNVVSRMGRAVIGFASRLLVRKKEERTARMHAVWDTFIGEYRQAVAFALRHRSGMIEIVLVALFEVVGYLSVTYCVYRGLGFSAVPYPEMTLLQAMLSIGVAFVPLPGASVATEGGFYALFTTYFGDSRLVAMLIWRFLTYYLTILLGLLAVVIDGFRADKRCAQRVDEPGEQGEEG
ncbi:MAG: YbhN family protein [Candidatus Aphodomorpha sp.]